MMPLSAEQLAQVPLMRFGYKVILATALNFFDLPMEFVR
jgi:hypothetical protein